MISLKEVKSKQDLKHFVKLPFKLYKDSKYWTPPIISQELKTFDTKENPVFKDAQAQLFLAYKNNELVGRIAVIINWIEVKNQNQKKLRIGWFDFIDDRSVSQALIERAIKIGKAHDLEYIEGPVGFSNLDKVGVMTEGFDSVATMITWYNHPYYYKHYEEAGFEVEKRYSESKFYFNSVDPELFVKPSLLIQKRYKLQPINFTKTEQVLPYVDKMFDLFNETYSGLASFVAINDIQKEYFKKKFISFVNPEYIKFITDENNNLICFTIVMPSFAKALKKMNGKLFPFGFMHLLHAKKHSKDVIFYLIGIHPDYQNKGVTAIIFNEYYKVFLEKGIETCYRTPELEDNHAIHQMWKHFSPKVYKRRRTYRKNLN